MEMAKAIKKKGKKSGKAKGKFKPLPAKYIRWTDAAARERSERAADDSQPGSDVMNANVTQQDMSSEVEPSPPPLLPPLQLPSSALGRPTSVMSWPSSYRSSQLLTPDYQRALDTPRDAFGHDDDVLPPPAPGEGGGVTSLRLPPITDTDSGIGTDRLTSRTLPGSSDVGTSTTVEERYGYKEKLRLPDGSTPRRGLLAGGLGSRYRTGAGNRRASEPSSAAPAIPTMPRRPLPCKPRKKLGAAGKVGWMERRSDTLYSAAANTNYENIFSTAHQLPPIPEATSASNAAAATGAAHAQQQQQLPKHQRVLGGLKAPPPVEVPSEGEGGGAVTEKEVVLRDFFLTGRLRRLEEDKAVVPTVYPHVLNTRDMRRDYVSAVYGPQFVKERNGRVTTPDCSLRRYRPDQPCTFCDVVGNKSCAFCIEFKNRHFALGYEQGFLPRLPALDNGGRNKGSDRVVVNVHGARPYDGYVE